MKAFRCFSLGFFLLLGSVFCSTSFSETYPTHSIELVVPFEPGGGTDTVARRLAAKLSLALGQSVVVLNKPGAATQIGSAYVAKSPPTGYRLLLAALPHATNPSLFKSLPYDTERDFSPIALVAKIPSVLVVNAHLTAKSIDDLVTLSKASPRGLNYASAGPGTAAELAMELLKQRTGLKATDIPYKGAGPQMTALVGGQVDIGFLTLSTAQPYLANGTLRALGIATARRSSRLPSVPTLEELGLPNFEAAAWFGLLAPANTPAVVISILNKAVNSALIAPDLRKAFDAEGIEPVGSSPEEFTRYIASEIKKWSPVIKAANIQAK